MIHDYEYSVIGDMHTFKFTHYPIKLILTPAFYLFNGVDIRLNLLCIDIIRTGKKKNCDAGETICFILLDFINKNRNFSLGYYPSFSDEKEQTRLCLFSKWTKKYFNDNDDITVIKNTITFPSFSGAAFEGLTFQVFMHNDFEYQEEMLNNLNAISKSISSK